MRKPFEWVEESRNLSKPNARALTTPQVLVRSKDSFASLSELKKIQAAVKMWIYLFSSLHSVLERHSLHFTSLRCEAPRTDSSPPMNVLLHTFHISDFDPLKSIICSMENHQQ